MAAEEKKVKTGGMKVRRVICYIVLTLISILCLFWFYVLFINATRSNGELTKGFTLIPSKYLAKNWDTALHGKGHLPIVRAMLNSMFIAFASGILCTYFSTMTAYALHVYDFKLKKFMFTFIMVIMMIPTQVTALGFIDLVDKMGLLNNYIPLIVPAIAAPVVFFYLKQYMDSSLPLSLVEAARIDGAGEFRTFNSIVLPIMKPAIAVQMIFTFVSSWNNYFTPALILKEKKVMTLPILLATLRSMSWSDLDMGMIYVTIAFSIFPVIVVYILLSKFIVQGIAMGSVKG